MKTLHKPSKRQLRKADKQWATLRVQITQALEDVNATITPDGRRLRTRNYARYSFLTQHVSRAYMQTWFREMGRRGGLK